VKPGDVRFYLDADILGLSSLAGFGPTSRTPAFQASRSQASKTCVRHHHASHEGFRLNPAGQRQNLLIVTRDSKIQQHSAEIAAVVDNQGRMVALSSGDASTVWGQLEVVMTQWRRIEELWELPGPFIYTATRTVLKKVA
jgi:hypothetical protein